MAKNQIERKFCVLRDRDPITFAHKKTDDKPSDHSLHIHRNIELYFYIEGDAQYMVNNTLYALRQGDVMVISPNEPHMLVLSRRCRYERYYLVFPADLFSAHAFNPLGPLLRRVGSSSARLTLSQEAWVRVRDILRDMADLCREAAADDSDIWQIEMYTRILQLLCTLSEPPHAIEHTGQSVRAATLPAPLPEAIAYIDQNLSHIESLGEIANAIHISPSYLSSLFRRYMGMPLISYLQMKRIVLARQLLEAGHSVTYACYESGFSDCSYFIRIFKKHVGTTPLKYRAEFLGATSRGG